MVITQPEKRTQNCPLCKESQDVIVDGWIKSTNTADGRRDVTITTEQGYSFCNCRNIFFTDWKNIDQKVYNEDYTDRYTSPGINLALSGYLSYMPIVKEHLVSGRVLEIGCINPIILDGFEKSGFETWALDIIPHDFKLHETITGNFEDVEVDIKFDLIWASHIFEHFKDPIQAVKKCNRMLNKGGLLFVAMPDPYFIDFKQPYQWGHWHLQEHHIMWDMKSFCEVLKENGFEVIFAKRNFGSRFICVGDQHILVKKI